ncbi:RNA-binding domain-containing protein [Streptomyces sp. NPDC055105]|uniref:protein kinase domain-containing protein n=1 Tax=Streptomyces sp. NPDC055105 TaxID=3365719 RepID=UPI0037D69880
MARNGINRRELDKWAKGIVKEANKSLERAVRRNPSSVPVQFDTTTTGGGTLNDGPIESSAHLARLLLWLDAYAQQHPGHYVDVTRFVEEQELAEDASVLAFQLEQRGLADLARTFGSGAPHVHLTDEGHVAVHTLKNLQKDRAARLRYTMDVFLWWLYDTAGDRSPTDPSLFLATPGSFFAGAEIPPTDLQQALVHLAENDLIELIGTDCATVAISTQGVNWVLRGADIEAPMTLRLTAVLGQHPDRLTEGDLQRAVESRMPESVDLAWKRSFYLGTDAGKEELAKDVSAMANTAGGVVVIGIDDGEEDHAIALAPVDPIPGRGEEWIRAVLAHWTQPVVPNVGVRRVKSTAYEGKIYWVLTVLPSTQAPHAVTAPGNDRNFRVHVRHGTTTRTLAASEIFAEEWASGDGFAQQEGSFVQASTAPYEARGVRKDYACERFPFHRQEDGMADVFYATHKPTGTPVVLKQLRGQHPPLPKRARMAREIEVGCLLSDHPNAMPVWDAGADGKWFVMPKAQAVATECLDELKGPAALRDLVESLCSALIAAHDIQAPGAPHGWVHRDIKPSNVLRLDGRWVLADWGIARRPPGQTTHPHRTRVGVSMGSEGFAAPELSIDAHSAGPSADVYSLGQLIGWAVTGRNPQQNIPLIPESGPWRAVVREATRRAPERRPATVQAFLNLIAQEIDTPPVPPVVQAETLRDSLNDGAANAPEELVALAAAHPDDAALYCDVLLKIDAEALIPALMADHPRALEIVRAMPELLGTHRSTERGEVDAVILWLFTVARHAANAAQLDLLEECCNGAFTWDALWDQWTPQDEIRPWLRTLTGDAAGSVAGALRDHPDCARHFSSLANELRVDHRIRLAVSPPSPGSAGTVGST